MKSNIISFKIMQKNTPLRGLNHLMPVSRKERMEEDGLVGKAWVQLV
jgi:hypothetical protein